MRWNFRPLSTAMTGNPDVAVFSKCSGVCFASSDDRSGVVSQSHADPFFCAFAGMVESKAAANKMQAHLHEVVITLPVPPSIDNRLFPK
jgi:hypothetical protein